LSDFGIRASNVFLYYDDLPRATAFYIQVLGLELVSEYDNASIMRVATSSYIILVDAAKGMHSADEPKTVAIALLTDQLTQWYDHLQDKGVEIKYTYKPKDGGPHDGFVAIDPEGYLLEFELFKQHPENERLIPILDHNESIPVKLGNGLSFNATITWLYYKDMMKMKSFFETTLGLEQIVDQGWAEVYKVTNSGFIGLVDERRGMHKFTEDKAVTVSFIIDELDAWYDYVSSTSAFPLKSESVSEGPDGKYRAFVGYDPEGYFLEFDKFYEHPDNTVLLDYLGSK
jgi:catechol 2,3-dioxygenase-like lactoylglutathione lyase family enzyme